MRPEKGLAAAVGISFSNRGKMNYHTLRTLSLLRMRLLAASASVALLAGCALNSTATSNSTIPVLVGGVVHGGQAPIQGAVVNLYVTNPAATGYGQAAKFIGTATSDMYGNFVIDNPATPSNCPSGQQAYITSAGGYPVGSPALQNNSVLLMAALGDCLNINANTSVIINEVTTVAAGYALSGFMTTSASGSLFVANVSAPAANSAATGTLTVAAGLPHAFMNAANLASYVSGAANTVTAPISAAATTVTGAVPAVEINTLGDILQACVDAATGNATCTSLFNFTPSITGVHPTNTLQSMINLARNPYPSAAAMDPSTGLLSLASGTPAFVPILSVTPPDWALAITYRGSAFPGPYATTLDANDTVYSGRSSTQANIVGMSAYGVVTPKFTYTTGTGTAGRQIAADGNGNIWLATGTGVLTQWSASAGGTPTVYTVSTTGTPNVYGVAADKAGNIWVANEVANATGNIVEYAYTSGSPATYAQNYTATTPGGFGPVSVTVDAQQNIWTGDYYTSGNLASVIPNLSAGTPGAVPTYANSGSTTATPISATFSKSTKPWGLVIDASANAWYGMVGSPSITTTGLEEVIPTTTNGVITSLSPQAVATGSAIYSAALLYPGIDGAGTVFIPDATNATEGIHVYSTIAGTTSSNTGTQALSPPIGYLGCYPVATSPTTCGSGTSTAPYAVYDSRVISVDSTGSVWTGINSGGFTQLIGLAAPSWPLLASGNPGLSPGLTAVSPLP